MAAMLGLRRIYGKKNSVDGPGTDYGGPLIVYINPSPSVIDPSYVYSNRTARIIQLYTV